MVLVLLWRDDFDESFLFVLHDREILSTGLFKTLRKQGVCGGDKSAKGRKRRASVRTEGGVGSARKVITRNPREWAKFSTKDWNLNHHYIENLS
jgi:hypothetical protein